MQRFYGQPTDAGIDAYVEELTTLLAGRYLDYVEYGFYRDGQWVICLRYTAQFNGNLDTDDRAGRVYVGADINGASWYSFLVRNSSWWLLSEAERGRIEQSLPFRRSSASTPGTGTGVWVADKVYSNGGASMARKTFRPL